MKLTKRKAVSAAIALTLGMGAAAGAAYAHHSFAMFDFSKQQTFQGTVEKLQWTNPHVILWVKRDGAGSVQAATWNLELTSPGNLIRQGWSKRSFNPGERVEITTNPLRNGQNGGAFVKGTVLKTGKVWQSNLRAANGKANLD